MFAPSNFSKVGCLVGEWGYEATLCRAELKKIELQKSTKTSARAVFDRVTDSLGISPKVRILSHFLKMVKYYLFFTLDQQ